MAWLKQPLFFAIPALVDKTNLTHLLQVALKKLYWADKIFDDQ